ncbi:hypothetical protein [Nitrosomonas nitrosa]|uniref:hypothetical protein n=1 Tax=Nitrosomonas nitrosa TaxID=52442 RepID=UPI0023F62644|nr:hypothetical protein [Nitrosomonas nitrosa]MCO6433640.1 hypothetical protein [Nitrosomonas nitrosa]
MTVKQWQISIYEFFCITSISLITGIGLGWIQGFLAFRSLTFTKDGAIIGGILSTITGAFVYYVFLRKHLNIKNATNLIMLCIGTGCASALTFGWLSSFVTPVALIGGAMIIRDRADSRTKNATQ